MTDERLSHLTPVAILEDNGERDWPVAWRGSLLDALERQSIHNHGTVEVARSLTRYGFYEGDGFSIIRLVKTLDNETEVELFDDDTVAWAGPFSDFCASNKFEDAEVAEIEAALIDDGGYSGGGGAAAEWTLKIKGPQT